MTRASRWWWILVLPAGAAWTVEGCSSSNDTSPGGSDAGVDAQGTDAEQTADSGGGDDDSGGGGGDASDGGCPSSWTTPPTVDPSLVPDAGGSVLLHASASGTQDYTCGTNPADGGYVWTFVGPEATLKDCTSTTVATHFASDGGAARPEWQGTDGSYVIAAKVAAYTPDGGASSVPWLLLSAVSNSGSGPVGRAKFVQRLNTNGGVAPTTTCDVGTSGTTQKVPYTADYWFWGP